MSYRTAMRIGMLIQNSLIPAVMCDATHECPDGSTCCKQPSGDWGCCPSPNAVCCSDGEHCCPSGYKCSVNECVIESSPSVLPQMRKTPAIVKFTGGKEGCILEEVHVYAGDLSHFQKDGGTEGSLLTDF